ncbi:hypothetical protein ACQPXB_33615 [Amycolatopsis sp. CA-161197]|uniref:hypothetical protein n=1 Tax=Amycolatopsis sp. CA-161197 TaxID=3239922 RepID=UPI003D939D43
MDVGLGFGGGVLLHDVREKPDLDLFAEFIARLFTVFRGELAPARRATGDDLIDSFCGRTPAGP